MDDHKQLENEAGHMDGCLDDILIADLKMSKVADQWQSGDPAVLGLESMCSSGRALERKP